MNTKHNSIADGALGGSSRRGFLGTLVKVALGIGAAAAGIGAGTKTFATNCCPMPYCNACPTSSGWTSSNVCCFGGSQAYNCQECAHDNVFSCSVVTLVGGCPQVPAHQ